jgi:hypothetical protein
VLTIQDLIARYGVSRQQIYERLRRTCVTPSKRGNRSYFSDEDVAILDAQHDRLREGFSLRDSVGPTVIDVSSVSSADSQLAVSEPGSLMAFAEVLASAISQSSALHQPDSRHLTPHRQLQEIADNEWLVTTRVLARCLGLANGTLHSWNRIEHRHGFRLERSGRGTWRVFKS